MEGTLIYRVCHFLTFQSSHRGAGSKLLKVMSASRGGKGCTP